MKSQRWLTALLVGATSAGGFMALPATAAADPPGPPAAAVQGERAIQRLGVQLPATAAGMGWSAAQLRHVLSTDSTAWIDAQNRLFYVEETAGADHSDHSDHSADGLDAGLMNGATAPDASTSPAAATVESTFSLHSRPAATRKVYLDVDGHVTTGTIWNSNFGSTITSEPFDQDGSPTTWSAGELAAIQGMWARVSEDFAPYDIDVTTEEPGAAGLSKSSSTDVTYGTRVVITPSNFYSTSAGGVAYMNTFSASTDTPVFVFSRQLSNSERNIAEASSHEIGHSVGLAHDGTSTSTYYSGHGGWAPIMGVGYGKSIVQWSRGEYADANNTQDDLQIIQGHAPLLSDDFGNTPLGAAALSSPVSVSGAITTRADVDMFRLDAAAGTIDVTATPAAPSPNLDLELALLDSTGAVLGTVNPTGVAAPRLISTVVAGTYYLRVDGVGTGDPTTGYSDYASIGRYTLSGSFAGGTSPPPPPPSSPPIALIAASAESVEVGTTVTFDGSGSSDPDGGAIVAWAWTLDGAPLGETTSSIARSFAAEGTYTVGLTVTDDEDQTASTSSTVTVTPAVVVVSVQSVSVHSGSTAKSAAADIVVVDSTGARVPGAIVSGEWTGQARGSAAAVTDGNGVAITPDISMRRNGRVSFKVTSVELPSGSTMVWDGVPVSDSAKI